MFQDNNKYALKYECRVDQLVASVRRDLCELVHIPYHSQKTDYPDQMNYLINNKR